MSETDKKIDALTNLLTWFITKQEAFNSKQEAFNSNQEEFNEGLIQKIDKSQYFLEDCISRNAKLFFDEQSTQAARLKLLDDEVSNLRSNVYEMNLQIRSLQKA